MKHTRSQTKAFTILELILTITLIALVAVPASMSLFNHLRKTAISSVMAELSQMAEKARFISAEFNIPTYLLVNTQTGQVSLQWQKISGDSGSQTSVFEPFLRVYFTEEVRIYALSVNGNAISGDSRIIFRPDGTGDYAEITLASGQEEYEFIITPLLTDSTDSKPGQNTRVIDLNNSELVSSDVFK